MANGSKRSLPTSPNAAAVVSELMIEPMKTPWVQSNASRTRGTTPARRPPNMIPSMGTPAGSSHSEAIAGSWLGRRREAGVGVGRRAAGVGCPVLPLPVDQVRRRRLGQPLPPDVAVVGEGHVREDAVGVERPDRVRVGLHARAGRDAEEARLRVDRVEAAVIARAHPADVVADRLDCPAGERRHQHREVRLAAGGREGAGEVLHAGRRAP